MDIYVTNPLKYSLWKQPTGVVAHTFDPRAQDVGACDFSEFKANLVNRLSSRTAKAIQRKKQNNNKKRWIRKWSEI